MSDSKDGKGERISEAEHAIMEVIWDRHPVSATDICEEICVPWLILDSLK